MKLTKPESARKWAVCGQDLKAWSIEGLRHPHPGQCSNRKTEFPAEKKDSGHNPVQRIKDQTCTKPHSSFDIDNGSVVQPCKFRSYGWKPLSLWWACFRCKHLGLSRLFPFEGSRAARGQKKIVWLFASTCQMFYLHSRVVDYSPPMSTIQNFIVENLRYESPEITVEDFRETWILPTESAEGKTSYTPQN